MMAVRDGHGRYDVIAASVAGASGDFGSAVAMDRADIPARVVAAVIEVPEGITPDQIIGQVMSKIPRPDKPMQHAEQEGQARG